MYLYRSHPRSQIGFGEESPTIIDFRCVPTKTATSRSMSLRFSLRFRGCTTTVAAQEFLSIYDINDKVNKYVMILIYHDISIISR